MLDRVRELMPTYYQAPVSNELDSRCADAAEHCYGGSYGPFLVNGPADDAVASAIEYPSRCLDLAWAGAAANEGNDECAALTKRGSCKQSASGCAWDGPIFSKGGRCRALRAPTDEGGWGVSGKNSKKQTCTWTQGKASRCKREGTIGGSGAVLTGYAACPATCGDDLGWRAQNNRQSCKWTRGKKNRCAQESATDSRKGSEACPVACAEFYKQ